MSDDRKFKAFLSSIVRNLGADADGLLKAFAVRLYENAHFQDLKAYDAATLANAAREGLEFFKTHRAGRADVRVSNPSDPRLSDVTAIQISNDDMPFIMDSVLGVLNDRGLEIRLALHPVVATRKDKSGGVLDVLPRDGDRDGDGVVRQSMIHIYVERMERAGERAELRRVLKSVLDEVRVVVADWRPMQDALEELIADYRNMPPPIATEELDESLEFMRWLLDDHFTLLGVRTFDFTGNVAKGDLKPVPRGGLGLLRNPDVKVLRRGAEMVSYTPELIEFMGQAAPLIITKTNVISNVHRRTHMDYIGMKRFDDGGKLRGELRIVGLFTSTAYTRSPRSIPILRRRVNLVVRRSRFRPESHFGKALMNVLETYPRDELFQIDPEQLDEIADGIMRLNERPRPRLFVRVDKFDRFASVLAFFPRDRYTSDVRADVGDMLATAYEGVVSAFYPSFPEGTLTLVRVHYIIGHRAGRMPHPSPEALERRMIELVRTWDDRLAQEIARTSDAPKAELRQRTFGGAFSVSYQAAYEPDQAIKDIGRIEAIDDGDDVALVLYRRQGASPDRVNLKLYHLGDPIRLSDRLPILEQLGLKAIDERTFTISADGAAYVLHDIALQTADGSALDLAARGKPLEDAFRAVWSGRAENDGYNNLVLKAGLGWRETALLRALGHYLKQAGIPYSDHYLWQALIRHSEIAGDLWKLFETRFSVDGDRQKRRRSRENRIAKRIETALVEVPGLDDDRILRRFMNLIRSSLRTNYYQTDESGDPRPTIAIKIDSGRIDGLPEPRPYREIFVYAPDVEGIHLRGGPIARGGLRWSDRTEDFRTEVLSLAKAQQVKNAVIVPVGAKGGFLPKKLGEEMPREERQEEGERCYRLFVTSLLQITDNLKGVEVIPPKDVVRHDGDDPYLVVAADKGTATFSDIANDISEAHGFWLGDAFASGGSAGYDHKKMGITARGAWEAVKRSFREMNVDIQTRPFDVIGCGDMSGDVFGNGMLLSKTIRLLAAFDHRDIFIDPDPNPARSWAERKRMFDLPRSTWRDYNAKLVSKGGGIFSRSLKTVPLSAEMRAMTGLTAKSCTPNELIRALLKSPCDLLWFGGIGTYVRATGETDADAGDRANDALRVTAPEIRAKVVGEGANLGFTQLARIEFDRRGGRINSDAIDNSAGVNSSDLEVNIKIALGAAEQEGRLSRRSRNRLLEKMTDEVAELALRNNYLQTLAITMTLRGGEVEFGFMMRMMQTLEASGELDRRVEHLPDNAELEEREAAGQNLARPEIAVMMAYAKLVLFDRLQAGDVASEPYFARELFGYFPARMRRRHADQIEGHRLGGEIISTVLANDMINFAGPPFVNRLLETTDANADDLARSFVAANDVLGLTEIRAEIDALDNRVESAVQIDLYAELQTALRRQMVWFAHNGDWSGGIRPVTTHYGAAFERLASRFSKVLPERQHRRVTEMSASLKKKKVPADLAAKISDLRILSRSSDVVLVAGRTGKSLEDVGQASFAMAHELGIDQIVSRAMQMSARDHYERLAINRAVDGAFLALRAIMMQMFSARTKGPAMQTWMKGNADRLDQTRGAVHDMTTGSEFTLARLTLAASALSELAGD